MAFVVIFTFKTSNVKILIFAQRSFTEHEFWVGGLLVHLKMEIGEIREIFLGVYFFTFNS